MCASCGSNAAHQAVDAQARLGTGYYTYVWRLDKSDLTEQTATEKVRLAEDGWNGRDPAKVALAYTPDSRWRNRSEFVNGREAIEAFLRRKWARELDYRLIKELWTFAGNRIRGVTYSPFMPLIAVAIIYLILVMFLTRMVGKLERRLRQGDNR